IVIRTTFIVGFPGETEDDFQELCDFVKKYRFDNAGVFKYSQEEGTVAGQREDQVPEDIKENRYDTIMSLQAKISEELHKESKGQVVEVVVEGYDPDEENLAYGRSYREAPDIDGSVFIENAVGLKTGDFVRVRIEEGFTYESVGSLEEKG
ncbi:MAG: TRAM domain-containing protein, partial [Acidaminococcaceae bacterium]|nr:TRAM domain-containing protein [Acidaminococcaceae bacterium]